MDPIMIQDIKINNISRQTFKSKIIFQKVQQII
jgi:hypothetical protein